MGYFNFEEEVLCSEMATGLLLTQGGLRMLPGTQTLSPHGGQQGTAPSLPMQLVLVTSAVH